MEVGAGHGTLGYMHAFVIAYSGHHAQSSFCLAVLLAWGVPPFLVAIHLEQGHMGKICQTSTMGKTIDVRAAASDGGAAEWKHGALILDSLRDEGHTLVLIYELGVEERHGSWRRLQSCMVEPCSMQQI